MLSSCPSLFKRCLTQELPSLFSGVGCQSEKSRAYLFFEPATLQEDMCLCYPGIKFAGENAMKCNLQCCPYPYQENIISLKNASCAEMSQAFSFPSALVQSFISTKSYFVHCPLPNGWIALIGPSRTPR